MKKLILFIAVLISASAFAVPPAKGGYLGRRFIVAGEFGYSPNYFSLKGFLTSYNPQFGFNAQFVCGRYWQVGVNYNRYILRDVELYSVGNPLGVENVNGTSIGFTARKYRIRKGGLAPIGKFVEFGISRHSVDYIYQGAGTTFNNGSCQRTAVYGSFALGVQEIFKDRIVANCGVRFAGKIFTVEEVVEPSDAIFAKAILSDRTLYHNAFTPFAGLGIIF
ncbi:MAG: hypothetical protein L6Q81_01645 [Bacteroidia bacterium]|nr:hypothetical protein [Bacteroidia bacterium]